MRILYPEAFFLLLLIIPVVLVAFTGYRRGKQDLKRLGGAWQQENLFNVYLVKSFFSTFFFVLGFSFGVLALAGFTWGQKPVEEDRSGLDIMFLVDISRSMLAEDVPPSRLARSGEVMRGVMQEFRGSRFSMTVFKGGAVQVVPLTEDATAIDTVIDTLHTGMMSIPGTDIAAGIEKAVASFPGKMERHRIVLLFSDGEFLAGLPLKAARIAGDSGIPIDVIGAGGTAGVTIPLTGGGVVEDADGKAVLTSLRRGVLDEIASQSGGKFFLLSEPQVVGQLLKHLRELEGNDRRAGFRLEMIHHFRLFLLLSLSCFALYLSLRIVKWKKVF